MSENQIINLDEPDNKSGAVINLDSSSSGSNNNSINNVSSTRVPNTNSGNASINNSGHNSLNNNFNSTDSINNSINNNINSNASISAQQVPAALVAVYVRLLTTGFDCLKYANSSNSKPHEVTVKISSDLTKITWGKSKYINTNELKEICIGRLSPVFKKYDTENSVDNNAELLSFSLFFQSRSLDLQLLKSRTVQDRNQLIQAFRWLCKTRGLNAVANNDDSTNPANVPEITRVGSNSLSFPNTTMANSNTINVGSSDRNSMGPDSSRGVSAPFNVQHISHVNANLQWTLEDLEQTLELVAKIGEGAFGAVWLGRHKRSKFEMAVKMVNTQGSAASAAALKHELDILKQCRNRYIVSFYGWYEPKSTPDTLWILMDYCAAGSIISLLKAVEKSLSEAQIAFICHSTLMALVYLNSKKIIHRDVKGNSIKHGTKLLSCIDLIGVLPEPCNNTPINH
jgi:hypothetical protein